MRSHIHDGVMESLNYEFARAVALSPRPLRCQCIFL